MSVQQATPLRAASGPVTIIRPRSGLAGIHLGDLWTYRDLLMAFATRDVKLRYRQTILGVVWVVLQPLIGAVIFAMISRVAKISLPDVAPIAFSFASLLGWTLFQAVLTKSGNCLVGNAQLVAKVFFPRIVLPLSTIPGALLDFSVALGVMVVIMVIFHVVPTVAVLLLPLFIVGLLMLAVGAGMVISALSVSYRDVQYIVPVLVNFLLFASPILMPASLYKGNLYWVMLLNPLSGFIEGIRWSLLGTPAPTPAMLAYSFGSAIVVFFLASVTFRNMERRFADVI